MRLVLRGVFHSLLTVRTPIGRSARDRAAGHGGALFSWIDRPVFDAKGQPVHSQGVVPDEPGLYFLGLPFLYAMSSVMVHGGSRDAARVAGVIARRLRG